VGPGLTNVITIKAEPEYITGFFLVSVTEDQFMDALPLIRYQDSSTRSV
jgi:hypothetical protein